MMTTDKLWNAHVDDMLYRFEQEASCFLEYAARGTSMSSYQIRDALKEARASVERSRNSEED